VDYFDIDPFMQAVMDPAGYAAAHPICDLRNADMDSSGMADFFDMRQLAPPGSRTRGCRVRDQKLTSSRPTLMDTTAHVNRP
jgi:hypothetical protein